MDDADRPLSESPEVGLSRRRFLHGAALASAALATPTVFAQSPPSPGPTPVGSLSGPAAPPLAGADPLAPPDKQPPHLEIPIPHQRLGWAIVGLGELALGEILPAFAKSQNSRLAGLVSGHRNKAKKIADFYKLPEASIYGYMEFDRIAEDKDIDVVYIALPNSMHAEFTIRALQAGKHVLCEKPMACTVAECEAMIAAAQTAGRQLGVAYRLHYEPMNLAVMDMCRRKEFGEIKTFSASHCQDVKAPNIRLSAPLGGGPVGDLGIYCINAARYTINEEPLDVMAVATQPQSDFRFREVPESVSFLLRYPSGVLAACECSFGSARLSHYQVLCSKGTISMDPAFSYRGLRLRTQRELSAGPEESQRFLEPVDQFAAEMDAFSRSIQRNDPFPTPGEMGLRDMRIVLAVLESARLGGQPVKVA
ncbi:MAG TPA: Gfo/Idh/MocA family oxidoreductase [Chthoniobacterales bacterium]